MYRNYYEVLLLKKVSSFRLTIMSPLKALLIFICILLAACTEKLWIIKPLNVALPNQTAMANFVVEKYGGYRFALAFVWGSDMSEREKQRELWGWGDERNGGGIPIPIHLRVIKDGEVFFDEVMVTRGVDSGQSFYYDGKKKPTAVRDIKHFGLPPGNYFVEVRTLEAVEEFQGAETYIEFSYYSPKI